MGEPDLPEKRHAITKPDKRGRDGKRHRKKNPPTGPKDCGVESWCWLPVELIQSPAWTALSRAARLVADRVLVEHVAQGGASNGELVISHAQFMEFGVTKNRIAGAIRECEAAGVLAVKRRGKIAGRNAPNFYRLTWLGGWDARGEMCGPTNDWKARTAAQVERARAPRRKRPAPPANVIKLEARNS